MSNTPKKDEKTNDLTQEDKILQILSAYDAQNGVRMSKGLRNGLIIGLIIMFIVVIFCTIYYSSTLNKMQAFYNKSTEEIITAKESIEMVNSWERLPVNQRKERLRDQYFNIIRYYTNNLPPEQKMEDDQIIESFNTVWNTTQRIPSINFFLPVAYIKAITNFNPSYNKDFKKGIAAFYTHNAEQICNLELVRTDIVFKTIFKGVQTLNNPNESIKLLVAQMDSLSQFFNNREDWIFLALFEGLDKVIKDYWDGGDGTIPDFYYREGPLAEALMYYQSFKSWQIPAIPTN